MTTEFSTNINKTKKVIHTLSSVTDHPTNSSQSDSQHKHLSRLDIRIVVWRFLLIKKDVFRIKKVTQKYLNLAKVGGGRQIPIQHKSLSNTIINWRRCIGIEISI